MKRFQLLFLSFLLGWAAIGAAGSINSEANDFAISDFDTVTEAVDSIEATLEDQGLEIVGVIDHAANAENVDLELPATQLILFRDHRLEKRLLRKSPMLAIDLPQKILVWEDPASGEIKLLYNTDGYLSDRHGIKTRNLLHRLNQSLKQFGHLDNGLITIDSQFSVEDTIENLKMVLQDNGFFIPFTYDFTGKSNKEKPSQLIIFGNPKVGTPLMQNQQAMGLDLPQKFLVWEDDEGLAHVTYNDPKFIGQRHGLQGLDTVLGNIANRLGALANEGAGNELVDPSNLRQSTSSLPIAQADINFPVMVVVGKPTAINHTTYQAVDNALRGPTRIPGTHTNSQSNSNANTINIVNPSVKMSPEEVLKMATDRAQNNADRAAKKAREKAKRAQTKADEAKQEAKQKQLEADQEKLKLDQMATPSRSQQRRADRAQREADRALEDAKEAQYKADLLGKVSTVLKTRAAKGIDKNIIQGFGQAALDSGKDLGEAFSLGFKLLRNPEMIGNLLDAIGEAKEALQDPARRAEMVKLISEALGDGIVGAIENFSQDKDYYTGYIAASIFDPIGKIGKLGKLSDVARGLERIAPKRIPVPKNLPKNIHSGQQGKHIPGHNNFTPGRSPLAKGVNPQKLLDGVQNGFYPIVRMTPRGQPVVNFGKTIGQFKGKGTQFGIIHHGKNGAHIVPANPVQF